MDLPACGLYRTTQAIAEVPAEVVVTNHVMGLYELAAIHLSAEQPDLAAASLAIDAMAAVVEGLGDRLGDWDTRSASNFNAMFGHARAFNRPTGS